MISIQVSQKTHTLLYFTYTLKYRHSWRNVLNVTIFMWSEFFRIRIFLCIRYRKYWGILRVSSFLEGKKILQTHVICHEKVTSLLSGWPCKGPKNLLDRIQEWQDLWASCGREHKSQCCLHSELMWRKTMHITEDKSGQIFL